MSTSGLEKWSKANYTISQFPDMERVEVVKALDKKIEHLTTQISEELGNTTKYWFLSNAGGAVAVLGYLGTFKSAENIWGPVAALVCYLLGLIAVGVFHIARYYYLGNVSSGFNRDYYSFAVDEIGFYDLLKNHELRYLGEAKGTSWTITAQAIAGMVSFIFFITGSVVGVFLLL